MTTSRLRIVVSGLAGLYPLGGVAWDYLQYVIGLHRLGHDVVYHEDSQSWPYHPIERRVTSDGRYSAQLLDGYFERYAPELRERWHYVHLRETSYGMTREAFDVFARSADVFLNVSGACPIPEGLSPSCLTVFLDTDPGYNQIVLSERPAWSENVDLWCAGVAAHDRHATYAEGIGTPSCAVPTVGYNWVTTRMPVVLDLWAPLAQVAPPPGAPWTTVMTWNAFKGPLLYEGIEYRSKGAEFAKIAGLPARVSVPLRVAVGGKDAPRERLRKQGWGVEEGPEATLTPERYQAFIAGSRGEISTAKHVYVALRTGWFSSRSACYLAAGRPAVLQDTGFSAVLSTGEGLIAFSTADEAAAAIETIEADYARHSRAARALAEEQFRAETVLADLLDTLGL